MNAASFFHLIPFGLARRPLFGNTIRSAHLPGTKRAPETFVMRPAVPAGPTGGVWIVRRFHGALQTQHCRVALSPGANFFAKNVKNTNGKGI